MSRIDAYKRGIRVNLPGFLDRWLGWPGSAAAQSLASATPATTEGPLKVLCYAPYTRYSYHSAVETVLLNAMRLRGHTTKYVMCDGSFTQCDICRIGADPGEGVELGPYAENSREACWNCQHFSRKELAGFGIDPVPFSQWITAADRREAKSWANGLSLSDFSSATFGDWPIGEWVSSSVQTHFRHNIIDLSEPGVGIIYRRYLESGLIACFAIERMLATEKPDLMLLFNGRMSSTRIALELATRRTIRTIVEERGIPGYIRLFENLGCNTFNQLDELWARWKDVPLSNDELSDVVTLLAKRTQGEGFEFRPFSAPLDKDDNARQQLGLDSRPVWLVMTSSPDECAQDEFSQGLFASQNDWVEALVDHAAQRTDIQLVVRVHPNIGSSRSNGTNLDEIRFFDNLASKVPSNVHIIRSDESISTYTLMRLAEVGLVWHSSVALEMACMGKCVIRSGGMFFRDKEFLLELGPGPQFDTTLLSLRKTWTQKRARQATRLALRCAYIWYFRQSLPLPLVSQPNWYGGQYAFVDADILRPGGSPELDHLIDILCGETELLPHPRKLDLNRVVTSEDEHLATMQL